MEEVRTPSGEQAEQPALTPEQLLAGLGKLSASGANWFYWIAGLSFINAIIAVSGGKIVFVVGLGLTEAISTLAAAAPVTGKAIALFACLLIVAFWGFIGLSAYKHKNWAFVLGMVLYLLDTPLLVFIQDWLGVGFHLFALYFIFKGYKANRALVALERQLIAAPASTGPVPPIMPVPAESLNVPPPYQPAPSIEVEAEQTKVPQATE